jgi:hypothetical protein
MNFRDMMKYVGGACCAAVMMVCCNVVEVVGMKPSVLPAEDNKKIIFNFEPLKAALALDREKFTPEYVKDFMQNKCDNEIVREQAKNVFLTGDSELYSTLGYNISTNYFTPDCRKFFANHSDQCVADFLVSGTIIMMFDAIEQNRRLLQHAFCNIGASVDLHRDILSEYFVTDLEKLHETVDNAEILNPDIYKGFDDWEDHYNPST